MKTISSRFCFYAISFVVLLFSFANSAEACSCLSPGPPCQSFWNADAVFVGEVNDIKETPINSSPAENTNPTFRSLLFLQKTVNVSVKENFRGTTEQNVEILTGRGGGDCGYKFETGQKYLIYAYKNSETGKLVTGICTRTRLLEKASEDIEYFRGLESAKSGSRIFGFVTQNYVRKSADAYKKPTPLSGISVIAESETKKFETKTDEEGRYSFADLLSGEYKLSLLTPKNLWGYETETKVRVFDKGCAQSSFFLQTKTFLSGRILNENSEPFVETSVHLLPADQINKSDASNRQLASTDKNGEFIFRSIPSGKYYLGIRLAGMSDLNFPYPQTFYPGTTDLEKAEIITVNEGDALENFDFKIPKKLSMRKVEGKVIFPDGKPAAGASLTVSETEYFRSYSLNGAGETEYDGTFSVELADGIRYLLKAYVTLDGKQFHAEPIEISRNGNVKDLKLVITEPNGNCEKCLNWKRPKPETPNK